MKKLSIIFMLLMITILLAANEITADKILSKMDDNRISDSQTATIKMTVHGRRNSRTLVMKSYSRGNDDSFTEYLEPVREKGTKMLKLNDNLWIYSPSTDRIIKISGHMLRQSVMGSDLSYEDLMTETEMQEDYTATILGDEIFNERTCWKLELLAKSLDLAYSKRLIWVDKIRFIALKEELYSLSGTLLKESIIHEVFQVEKRWYPKRLTYRDVLKKGKGTEIFFEKIQFNQNIPASTFSKAALRK